MNVFSVLNKKKGGIIKKKHPRFCVYMLLDNGGRLPNDCADLPSERGHAVGGSRSPLQSNHPQDKGQLTVLSLIGFS